MDVEIYFFATGKGAESARETVVTIQLLHIDLIIRHRQVGPGFLVVDLQCVLLLGKPLERIQIYCSGHFVVKVRRFPSPREDTKEQSALVVALVGRQAYQCEASRKRLRRNGASLVSLRDPGMREPTWATRRETAAMEAFAHTCVSVLELGRFGDVRAVHPWKN